MFIGGLNGQTTPENLKKYFEQFGDVIECMIMKDAITKRSRGFGFITFRDAISVDKVLAQEKHLLDEKIVNIYIFFIYWVNLKCIYLLCKANKNKKKIAIYFIVTIIRKLF